MSKTKRNAKRDTNAKASDAKETKQNVFTPFDVARELKMTSKNVRRMMRARDMRVGKGKRHMFDKSTFNRIVKTLRDATTNNATTNEKTNVE